MAMDLFQLNDTVHMGPCTDKGAGSYSDSSVKKWFFYEQFD